MAEKRKLEPISHEEEPSSEKVPKSRRNLNHMLEIAEGLLVRPCQPAFSMVFYELGKVFREGDQDLIDDDLKFLLKWGLNYGNRLFSYKASQSENDHMEFLTGPYELRERSHDLEYLTIPKLMIEFAGITMILAQDMRDTVSGVGEDKRLETPAYARVIRLLESTDKELAKRHEEAHLYARYMFSEVINKRNESWQSKSISEKIGEVRRFYQIAKAPRQIGWLIMSWEHIENLNKENKLLTNASRRENLIALQIIDRASADWQQLLAATEAS